MISGGQAVNIIPERCSFEWEMRFLPGEDVEEVNRRLASVVATFGEDVDVVQTIHATVPPLSPRGNGPALAYLQKLLDEEMVTTAPFVTEAGIYQEAGIPAIVCGPGEIDQAHRPDERVSIQSMERCHQFVTSLLMKKEALL